MVYSLWFGAVRRSTIRGGLKYVAVSTVFESAPNTYIAHTLVKIMLSMRAARKLTQASERVNAG